MQWSHVCLGKPFPFINATVPRRPSPGPIHAGVICHSCLHVYMYNYVQVRFNRFHVGASFSFGIIVISVVLMIVRLGLDMDLIGTKHPHVQYMSAVDLILISNGAISSPSVVCRSAVLVACA